MSSITNNQGVLIDEAKGLFFDLAVYDHIFSPGNYYNHRALTVTNSTETFIFGGQAYGFSIREKRNILLPISAYSWYAYKIHKILLRRPDIKKITAIGLGCGSGFTQLLATRPDLSIEVVEIDPVVIDIARKNFAPLAHYEKLGKISIIQADGRDWFRQENLRQKLGDFVYLDITADTAEKTNEFFQPLFQCYVENNADFDIAHNQQYFFSDSCGPNLQGQEFLAEHGYKSYIYPFLNPNNSGKITNFIFSTLEDTAKFLAKDVASLNRMERKIFSEGVKALSLE